MLQEIQILNQSSKSTVTLMWDTEEKRNVVVKELAGEHPVYDKLKELRHPYLPRIYSTEQKEGVLCVTEEYIDGAALGDISLSERELSRAFLELCCVLEFLHGEGIVHRDIKPDNILLAPDGHIRLIDFDAAREPKEGDIQDTCLLGTRGYAPPEQYGFSQTDARADFYALGATFRQLLGPIARKGRWKRILRKCTAIDPDDRYRSAGQIRRTIYRGRILRWIIRPICLIVIIMFVALSVSIFTTPSPRFAVLSLFGMADTEVWQEDEISEDVLRKAVEDGSAPLMYEYAGSKALEVYYLLREIYPDLLIVYSGYMDQEGALVYGCIEATYSIRAGAYFFDGFDGVVCVRQDGIVMNVKTEEYDKYAPAVMAIYEVIQQMPK